jgi:hypothetical protein
MCGGSLLAATAAVALETAAAVEWKGEEIHLVLYWRVTLLQKIAQIERNIKILRSACDSD